MQSTAAISYPRNIFFVLVMLELFLMGSGRFLEIGPITTRMIFYTAGVFYSLAFMLRRSRIDRQIFWLLTIFIEVHLIALLTGFLNNADIHLILADIKPLAFFFMILFFSTFIRDNRSVNLTIKTIKAAAVLLMLAYLTFLALTSFKVIQISPEVIAMLENNAGKDIRFQQHLGVFYNGFFYLCIGFFFYAFEKGKVNKTITVLLLIAIIFTFSRGLLLATALVGLFYVTSRIILFKRKIKYIICLMLLCCAALMFYQMYVDTVGYKEEGDAIRVNTFKQVLDAVTPLSLFVGHGLGIGVEMRPDHMENSYLEIFHKQGILGLLFWFMLFVVIAQQYFKACRIGNWRIALPFMLSCLFTFILTTTNNYMNNPVGMPILLISVVVLNVLSGSKHDVPPPGLARHKAVSTRA